MKFYYLEDINKEHVQFFKTKKSALDWIKNFNTSDDYDNIPTKTWLAYYFWFYHIK